MARTKESCSKGATTRELGSDGKRKRAGSKGGRERKLVSVRGGQSI